LHDIVHVGGIYTEESLHGFLPLEGFPEDISCYSVDIYFSVVILLYIYNIIFLEKSTWYHSGTKPNFLIGGPWKIREINCVWIQWD
jgi:hypothetical protein